MELNISFSSMKTCFVYRITQKISDILWVILENGWTCILNCVSRFVVIIPNFNALCNAYTVQIQSYTALLKSDRIFSNEGDDHSWLYFVFLNYSPLFEKIDC